MTTPDRLPVILSVLVFAGLGAVAPAGAHAQQAAAQDSSDAGIPLVYEREVFVYAGSSRKDPFRPLVGGSGMGPRLRDMTLKGILYANERSVVLLADRKGNLYRLRQGERVGNARVIDIRPLQVRFAVEEFGNVHQEVVELKRERKGTGR